jgi:hypothetical protein
MAAFARSIFGPPLPDEHRWNFIHLYFDVFWWGILNGSTIAFLAVYASRINASAFQVGLLTAAPALVNVLLTLPITGFIKGKSSIQMVRWSNLIMRLFYILLIPLPILFSHQIQVWMIIIITLVMNIPGAVNGVMGNVFLAETIPPEWRSQVIGTRNALLAASSMLSSLGVGWILTSMDFTTGYMVVFAIGFVGSMGSSVHLFRVRPNAGMIAAAEEQDKQEKKKGGLDWRILLGPYGRLMGLMFLFHFSVFLAAPIFPLYQVRDLNFTDELISQGTALYWIIHAIAATQTSTITRHLGFKKMTGLGAMTTAVSIILFIYSYQPWIYLVSQVVSGIGWAMIGGALLNYLLQKIPDENRPPYLAWFNLMVNGSMLVCGLIAGSVVDLMGRGGGMWLSVALRALAAFTILLLG